MQSHQYVFGIFPHRIQVTRMTPPVGGFVCEEPALSRASVISKIRHLSGGSAWTTRVTEAVCLPPRMERVDEDSPSLVYAFFYAKRCQFCTNVIQQFGVANNGRGCHPPIDVRHHIFPTPNCLELLLQKLHCLSDNCFMVCTVSAGSLCGRFACDRPAVSQAGRCDCITNLSACRSWR